MESQWASRVQSGAIPLGIRIDGGYSRFGFKQGVDGDIHFTNVTGNLVYKSIPGCFAVHNRWRRLVSCGSDRPGILQRTENKFGWNVGGGINLPLSGFDTFIEAKYTQIQADNSSVKYIPITFGVMF